MASGENSKSDSRSDRLRDQLPLARRDYLQYAGAAAGALTASTSVVSADEEGGSSNSNSEENSSPIDLQVEYAREPMGIDTRQPRFSWSFDSGERSYRQSAYQILVASSRSTLHDNTGDVWDTEKTTTSQSSNIEYDGQPLQSRKRYFWKVRTWDDDGVASEWSNEEFFEMGLLDESDWEAIWIGTQRESNSGQLPGEEWTDYTFSGDFKISDRAIGFIFRAQDTDNLYMWQINLTGGSTPPNLRPHVRENGNWNVLDAVSIGDVIGDSKHDQHHIRITVEGSSIVTYLDNTKVDARTDTTHAKGTIGLRTGPWSNQRGEFDNLLVESPDGSTLFEEDFSGRFLESFPTGSIENGRLVLHGSGIVLRRQRDSSNPLLRKEVGLEGNVVAARAYVSGLGYYELYVNGEQIGDRVLDPARSDYAETDLYATHDVTDYINNGKNAIGLSLGRGRYGEPEPRIWAPPDGRGSVDRPNRGKIDWWSDPEVIFQLEIQFADGTTKTVVSDGSWKKTNGPTLYNSLLTFKETYDAREREQGWTKPGYDDSSWDQAGNVAGPAGKLRSQNLEPIRVRDTIKPIDMWEPKPGTFVFDLGQMIAGWVELTVVGENGTEVTLSEGEKLANDGTIDTIRYGGSRFHEQHYTLNGNGTETWEPRFSYGGFRYVQIEGYPGTPTRDSVAGKVIHSAVDETDGSQFSSSNDLLNQIHQNSRWAMLNNIYGIHHGTPTWEKLGWMADRFLTAEAEMYNFSMARIQTNFMQDCRDTQPDSGDMRYVVPSPEPYSIRIGDRNDPGWDIAYAGTAWLTYQYYGDERILEKNYDHLKQYVSFVQEESEDGLIVQTGLGDYKGPGYQFPPEGPAIVSTAHYYQAAQIVADAAAVLDRGEDEAAFRSLSKEIKTAFNEEFLDRDAAVYRTGQVDEYRQTSNAYPLAFDLVPEKYEDSVAENLAKNVVEVHDGHLDTGALGTRYLLPALTKYGYHDVAYTIATQTSYPSWGHWIKNDITALLESWELEARSRTHSFLGSIDQWFYQYLAGIREPAEPGFEHVKIAPKIPSDLEQASGKVETIRGTIISEWERTESAGEARTRDELTLDVTIPSNATATVRVQTLGGDKVRVRESGKPIWNNGKQISSNHSGVKSAERDGDEIVVEIGSGEYTFELEQLGQAGA